MISAVGLACLFGAGVVSLLVSVALLWILVEDDRDESD